MSHKEKLQLVANAIFTRHREVDKVFLASNGQGFTEEESAKAYAGKLKDKSVVAFEREAKSDAAPVSPDETGEDRAALMAIYEVLFGKKAKFNIGTKTLIERIAEKEAEIAASKEIEPGTGSPSQEEDQEKTEE